MVELLEERLGSFRSEMVTLIGAHSLTFMEFWACEALDYYEEKKPTSSR